MKDFNFTFLTGVIVSEPSWVPLANNKKALIFTLKNNEYFNLADGRQACHSNHFTIEVLGKNAERYAESFKVNQRVQVVGYLRVDEMKGADRTRVRAFRMEDLGG